MKKGGHMRGPLKSAPHPVNFEKVAKEEECSDGNARFALAKLARFEMVPIK